MAVDKSLLTGSTTLLILKLLEETDMYGYQMIEELSNRSDKTFQLKAGTLYPLLHSLEDKGIVSSYDDGAEGGRIRKFYHLTKKGHGFLKEKKEEWQEYSNAVNRVLRGGVGLAGA